MVELNQTLLVGTRIVISSFLCLCVPLEQSAFRYEKVVNDGLITAESKEY